MSTVSNFHDIRYDSFRNIPDGRLSDLMRAAKTGDTAKMALLNMDDKNVYDAFRVAAMEGRKEIVELMLKRGVNPNPLKVYDRYSFNFNDRYSAMGHAVLNQHPEIIKLLLEAGVNIEEVSYDNETALNVYFSHYPRGDYNLEALKIILASGAKVHSLSLHTLFKMIVFGNGELLQMLLEAGLDPNSVHRTESSGGTFYRPAVTILDLSLMRAEIGNSWKKDEEAIKMVALLLKYKAALGNHSYFSWVSHPELIKMLLEAGADSHSKTLVNPYSKELASPIERVDNEAAAEHFFAHGHNREEVPYLKGTKAHHDSIARNNDLINAYKTRDIAAFVALIGSGVDLNRRTNNNVTILHLLFNDISLGSISEEYDFTATSESLTVRLINMLIKHGAAPLKDSVGQTPLMYLSFNCFNTSTNRRIIDMYADFEAAYYKLDPKEYKEKLLKLREGGYRSQETLLSYASVPIRSVFDRFWASFENHTPFNPEVSHNPTADWNRLKSLLDGKNY